MSGYDEINRNIANMIEKGKNSASTSDATYYDEETRSYYSASDIKKLKEINEDKLADIESYKNNGVSDDDGKITSCETDIKTNKGVIGRLEGYFGTDEERKAAYNDVMNLIYNESETDDSISNSSSISTLSNVTNNTSETNQLGEGEQQNANTDNIPVAGTSEHENNNNLTRSSTLLQVSDNINNLDRIGTGNNTSETNQLGEEEQQNANTDNIPVAETSEHENNNLTRSSTLLQVSGNRNNLDRRGDGQHPDNTVTLSRSNNVMGVPDNWGESRFYNGPSPAKKDVTKLKKFGNFIKRKFKI